MRKLIKSILSITLCGVAIASAIIPATSVKAATSADFVATGNEPNDYAYSFMVIGDTQIVNYYDPDNFSDIYDYVIENVESKKVKHVFGLGDITDKDLTEEWERAKTQITRMDGKVSYSLIRGNHDMGPDFNAIGFTDKDTPYDQYFGEDSTYANQYVENFKGTRNTVHEFSAGSLDYLVVALDFGPTDEVLDWANEVVESYPNHTVIVTTHAYLNDDGTFLEKGESGHPASNWSNGGYTRNNGDQIWEKFVKKHENISMVLCGHVVSDDIVTWQREGDNGNIVTQMMINPQGMDADVNIGSTGMVATYYVSADGKTITVEYYSTIQKKYFNVQQSTLTVDTVERSDAPYVRFVVEGEGAVTMEEESVSVYTGAPGDTISISLNSVEGYCIKKVELDGVNIIEDITNVSTSYNELVSGNYTFSLTEGHHYLVVKYEKILRYLFVEQNELYKGKIIYDAEKVGCLFYPTTQFKFTIKPNGGYTVKKVTLNGVVLKPDANGYYSVNINSSEEYVLAVEYEK